MNRINRHLSNRRPGNRQLGNLGTCAPCSAMPLFGDAVPAPAGTTPPAVADDACNCGTAKLALVAVGGLVLGAIIGPMIRNVLNI